MTRGRCLGDFQVLQAQHGWVVLPLQRWAFLEEEQVQGEWRWKWRVSSEPAEFEVQVSYQEEVQLAHL